MFEICEECDGNCGVCDAVENPSHYTRFKNAEVIDITEELNFCRGNVVKYVARAGEKDPAAEIQDLKKAQWYLNREIDRLEGREWPRKAPKHVDPILRPLSLRQLFKEALAETQLALMDGYTLERAIPAIIDVLEQAIDLDINEEMHPDDLMFWIPQIRLAKKICNVA